MTSQVTDPAAHAVVELDQGCCVSFPAKTVHSGIVRLGPVCLGSLEMQSLFTPYCPILLPPPILLPHPPFLPAKTRFSLFVLALTCPNLDFRVHAVQAITAGVRYLLVGFCYTEEARTARENLALKNKQHLA